VFIGHAPHEPVVVTGKPTQEHHCGPLHSITFLSCTALLPRKPATPHDEMPHNVRLRALFYDRARQGTERRQPPSKFQMRTTPSAAAWQWRFMDSSTRSLRLAGPSLKDLRCVRTTCTRTGDGQRDSPRETSGMWGWRHSTALCRLIYLLSKTHRGNRKLVTVS